VTFGSDPALSGASSLVSADNQHGVIGDERRQASGV